MTDNQNPHKLVKLFLQYPQFCRGRLTLPFVPNASLDLPVFSLSLELAP